MREKLIELIAPVLQCLPWGQVSSHTAGDIADRLIANLVVISNSETTTKWIPVTERLPDTDGNYIVTACDEGCSCGDGIWYDTVVVEAEYYKGEWAWNENGTEYDISCFVTHWMPLPEPPKGE